MMKRIMLLLALLLIFPVIALGETEVLPTSASVPATETAVPTATPAPTPVPTPTPIPVLVDWINTTDHPDFAFAEDAPLLEVFFPQIHDCDAILLRYGGETLLVDCCTRGQAVRVADMCKQLGIDHIDRLVNTHPHEDHIGGLRNLDDRIPVDELWICFPKDYNKYMKAAVQSANWREIELKHYGDGDVLTLGDVKIEVWKLDGTPSQLNDCSAQLFVTFGERTMLLAADVTYSGQVRYVETKGDALDADILKYPHHGLDALYDPYAEAVSPLFTVVTNNARSTNGRYYIRNRKIPAAWTVPDFVYLATDGRTWLCDRIKSHIEY